MLLPSAQKALAVSTAAVSSGETMAETRAKASDETVSKARAKAAVEVMEPLYDDDRRREPKEPRRADPIRE
jgi:hypothetical protein